VRVCAALTHILILPVSFFVSQMFLICIFMQASVCVFVCVVITFEILDSESLFLVRRLHLPKMQVGFVYQGHRVKVKVMAVKKHVGGLPLIIRQSCLRIYLTEVTRYDLADVMTWH